jgi:hypothetical protein
MLSSASSRGDHLQFAVFFCAARLRVLRECSRGSFPTRTRGSELLADQTLRSWSHAAIAILADRLSIESRRPELQGMLADHAAATDVQPVRGKEPLVSSARFVSLGFAQPTIPCASTRPTFCTIRRNRGRLWRPSGKGLGHDRRPRGGRGFSNQSGGAHRRPRDAGQSYQGRLKCARQCRSAVPAREAWPCPETRCGLHVLAPRESCAPRSRSI